MKAASAADDRLAFAPPKQPGLLRALALAVLAHALLVLGLMQGLQWKRDGQQAAVEAELWSAVPQQAAPREVPAPPPPPPAPPVQAPPRPEPPVKRDADIALERAQKQRELEKQKQAELEREQRKKLEAKKREEELAKKKREEELARKKEQEEEQKLAEAKRKEDDRKRKELDARDAKKLAQMREENLRRIQGMAGGTGAEDSTGTAARASGPSPGWAGKVQARVRPHIVFSDDVSGNPKAEVEVRASPDGTIVSTKLVRSSGVKAWDEAVLRALDKAGALPRDSDGRVPSPVLIEFRPKG
jgi:colicin import membrane protein